jgi:hypothetical protein
MLNPETSRLGPNHVFLLVSILTSISFPPLELLYLKKMKRHHSRTTSLILKWRHPVYQMKWNEKNVSTFFCMVLRALFFDESSPLSRLRLKETNLFFDESTTQRIRRFPCLQDCFLTLTCHLTLKWHEMKCPLNS